MHITIELGVDEFGAVLHRDRAPQTCNWFLSQLPRRHHLIHARWSGEACWIPLGSPLADLPLECATSAPVPGELLCYPGGISECEILLPYGTTRFACSAGPLQGSRFLSIVDGHERLAAVGRAILFGGAQPISFSMV